MRVTVEDINGDSVTIEGDELYRAMLNASITLYGMDMNAIRQFHHEYFKLGGSAHITAESVKEVFRKCLQSA